MTERVGQLLYGGAGNSMIHLDAIREANRQGKTLKNMVVVFVGATNGIGESTAKELFIQTTEPKAYIIGR